MKQSGLFDLSERVAVITGGAGLLGCRHAEAIASAGGIPVLADIDGARARQVAVEVAGRWGCKAMGVSVDITRKPDVQRLLGKVLKELGRVDILINNAANNPKAEASHQTEWSRFETYTLANWQKDIAVGLTGAFLCSQIIGNHMAQKGGGVILNISSDLGLIAPDQRLYERKGLPRRSQPVKPVGYSVVKTGLLGLTRYLATYWAESGVRVNALCPGGVKAGQPVVFTNRIRSRIPLGRMARADEYQGAVLFLVSNASSYMTGSTLVVDGGRTCW